MDKRMLKKIARKALANLYADVASQALGQTEIALKPVAHAWIPVNILPASFWKNHVTNTFPVYTA